MEQTSNPPLRLPPPYVLIFHFPVQGHVNSTLKLAEILSIAGAQVTFVNTEHRQKCLASFTNIEAYFLKYPGYQFRSISDSVPMAHSIDVTELHESLELKSKPIFKQMLTEIRPELNCIIGDGFLGFILDTTIELGIPIIHFRTIGACCF